MAIPILNNVVLGPASLCKPLMRAHTQINKLLIINGDDSIFHSVNKEVTSR